MTEMNVCKVCRVMTTVGGRGIKCKKSQSQLNVNRRWIDMVKVNVTINAFNPSVINHYFCLVSSPLMDGFKVHARSGIIENLSTLNPSPDLEPLCLSVSQLIQQWCSVTKVIVARPAAESPGCSGDSWCRDLQQHTS